MLQFLRIKVDLLRILFALEVRGRGRYSLILYLEDSIISHRIRISTPLNYLSSLWVGPTVGRGGLYVSLLENVDFFYHGYTYEDDTYAAHEDDTYAISHRPHRGDFLYVVSLPRI